KVGDSKIAVVLRHFILQDQMASERIPRKVRDYAMILMAIVAIVSEYDVGFEDCLDLLEIFLNLFCLDRKKAFPEPLDHDRPLRGARDECSRARSSLLGARALSAEHCPPDIQVSMIAHQLEQCSAAPDFDIVGMRAEAEDVLNVVEA